MDYVKFIYRPLAARAAHHVLAGRYRVRQSPDRGRFTRADVDDLLKSAWVHYAERVGELRPEPRDLRHINVKNPQSTKLRFLGKKDEKST
jgi:hypothetical protein